MRGNPYKRRSLLAGEATLQRRVQPKCCIKCSFSELPLGAKNIACIIRIAENKVGVTRCNTLHHDNRQELFDGRVLALQAQSCEDMMQSIAALKLN